MTDFLQKCSGYKSSKIPVRVEKHCVEQARGIEDGGPSGRVLESFRVMKGSHAALRNTADAAALLVLNLKDDVCGAGYTDAYQTGVTFSVIRVK